MKTSISTRKQQVVAGIVAGAAVALAPLACAGTANAAPLPLEQPGNAQDIHGWHGGWYGGGHFGHGFGGPGFGRGWYGGP
ncbi:MAG: hypothetical protein J2P17_34560, partial [Mycobacterium sp.]|nr:hypothetical protein [Mycobacterium sp.]